MDLAAGEQDLVEGAGTSGGTALHIQRCPALRDVTSQHQSHNQAGLKPENSLLQRYKSVTAKMYSNKLGGGREGTGQARGACHTDEDHDVGSLLNNLYHGKSSTKINIEMEQPSDGGKEAGGPAPGKDQRV